jgi:hypothetical protein
MQNTALLFVVFLFLLQGCRGDEKSPEATVVFSADSILSHDKMVSLLADVQIAEGALTLKKNQGKETSRAAEFFYAGIFHKYRISRDCYTANLTHYQQDPVAFVKMYDEVIKRLADRESNYDAKRKSKPGVSSDRID